MRWMDYLLQKWRSQAAEKYICPGDILLDIGCFDGLFLTRVQDKVSYSVGLDIIVPPNRSTKVQNKLIVSSASLGLPFSDGFFNIIVLLAVFEHLPEKVPVIREMSRVLRPGGRVVLTVPGRQVDRLLDILIAVGVADGMSLDEHHGYQAEHTPALFESCGFTLQEWHRFQLGLNNLFVFRKN